MPNQIVEGQLSDSEAETETETDKLKAEIDSLKRQLSEKDSEYYTAENQHTDETHERITEGPLDDTEFGNSVFVADERVEALEREREELIQAKNDQIEELKRGFKFHLYEYKCHCSAPPTFIVTYLNMNS